MLLAVDKPSWITSYDAIRALKKIFWKEKIWHSGTLDPMASGLLLIGVGKGTKLLHWLQWLDKTYTTTIDFSKKSDTWDLDYREYFEEISIQDLVVPSIEAIKEKLNLLIPEYPLPLTPFSAKKKDGKKLYELARSGEIINETRIMKIHTYDILEYTFPTLQLELSVGSWTYIRSIGYWLGRELECWGILTSLRRESIWKYHLQDIPLEKSVQRFDKKTEKEYTIVYQEILVM